MAHVVSKGTALKLTIASVLTTIAQVFELSMGEQKSNTVGVEDFSSGAGEPYKPTGTSTQGEITGSLFYDPAHATHKFLANCIANPLTTLPVAGSIAMANSPSTSLTFSAAGLSLGLDFKLGQYVQSKFSIRPDGLVALPTS